MVCIHCGAKTQVINSRSQKRNNQVWRRRQCLKCQSVFTTEESTQLAAAWIVKSKQGALQPFSRDKLLISLFNCLKHRKTAINDATGLTDTVIAKLSGAAKDGSLEAKTMQQTVQVALNRFDKAASIQYQAFH